VNTHLVTDHPDRLDQCTGFLRSLEKYRKRLTISSLEKSGKNFFSVGTREKEIICILIIFCSDTFNKIDHSTFIV